MDRPIAQLSARRAALAVALSAVLAAGCTDATGGRASSADDAVASTITTSAPHGPPADDATRSLATAAVLRSEDFDSRWSEVVPAQTWEPSDDPCTEQQPSLPEGSVREGPVVRLGVLPAFVSSRAYVFPSEAEAQEWVEVTGTDAWSACVLAGYQRTQDDNATGVQMSVEGSPGTTPPSEELGGTTRLLGRDDEGRVVVEVVQEVRRSGRVVVLVTSETSLPSELTEVLSADRRTATAAAGTRLDQFGTGG